MDLINMEAQADLAALSVTTTAGTKTSATVTKSDGDAGVYFLVTTGRTPDATSNPLVYKIQDRNSTSDSWEDIPELAYAGSPTELRLRAGTNNRQWIGAHETKKLVQVVFTNAKQSATTSVTLTPFLEKTIAPTASWNIGA